MATTYQQHWQQSIQDPMGYWEEQAKAIPWMKFPKTILGKNSQGLNCWFPDGMLNTCYVALDYHIEQGRGQQIALYYDSPVTHTKKSFSYNELRAKVAALAGGLKKLGLQKGDTAILYMPMIPEAIISMLACARLGIVHSVVFGGFVPKELALRIDHAKPKIILSASCGIEVTKIIDYKSYVDSARELAQHKVDYVVIQEREQHKVTLSKAKGEFSFNQLLDSPPAECVELLATHPLYILYTSGTTGKPKGVLRDNGGHAVAMKYSMDKIYDTAAGEVYWAASDIGWVVGHSYIVYAPLIQGCSTIVYEGKPIKTPDASAFYRVMSEYKVKTFFTAPTAFRVIKKEDPEGKFAKQYNLDSLKYLFFAGERLDPATYHWLKKTFKNRPILDHWWQTESGWAIVSNFCGLEVLPTKVGSSFKAVPGYDVRIVNDEGKECKAYENGNIVIKLPLPPGTMSNLWKDTERFKEAYLSFLPGYYFSGDGGYKDDQGYIYVMGRVDDVINVAGHRFSTGQMEEILSSHASVAECAVVGMKDSIRGHIPVGFVVLKDGLDLDPASLEAQLIAAMQNSIGKVAFFKTAIIVKRLPKTRSGKILRRSLSHLGEKPSIPIPPTIDDPAILDEVKQLLQERKVGILYAPAI